MVTMYKGRQVLIGQKVKVICDLQRAKFTIKDFSTGNVLAHGDNFVISEISFKVTDSKSPIAYMVGVYGGEADESPWHMGFRKKAYCNPQKFNYFADLSTCQEVDSCELALCLEDDIHFM